MLANAEELPIRPELFEVLEQWSSPAVLAGSTRRLPQDQTYRTNGGGSTLSASARQITSRKKHQVASMGVIFKRSAFTGTWLGVDGRDGRPAINRTWWTRAWTLQENVLPETFIFPAGSDLSRGARANHGLEKGEDTPPVARATAKKREASRIPVCRPLVYAGGSDAEKPQDCMFATLGLIAKSEAKELGIRPRCDDENDAAIFEQLVRSRISRTGCLNIVCFADASLRNEDLDLSVLGAVLAEPQSSRKRSHGMAVFPDVF
ncbi:hypothetical protein DL769_003258 [Monosporascus sp. CRB-8-3]|nr:hypothetical protein DL769_003258 [Monosporascus sp. CRB-8-3]